MVFKTSEKHCSYVFIASFKYIYCFVVIFYCLLWTSISQSLQGELFIYIASKPWPKRTLTLDKVWDAVVNAFLICSSFDSHHHYFDFLSGWRTTPFCYSWIENTLSHFGFFKFKYFVATSMIWIPII